MLQSPTIFSKSTTPDVTYPGTFFWGYDSVGNASSSTYYGTVILLINQQTASHTEYFSMAFNPMAHLVIVGSQTDGDDGNVSSFNITQDIQTGFSSIGIYYANGDSTQRIGIVPNVFAEPTIAGMIAGRDEVLDKALEIACQGTSVKDIKQVQSNIVIFPNPTNDILNVNNLQTTATYQILNTLGQSMQQGAFKRANNTIQLTTLSPGIYLLELIDETGQRNLKKVVKE